VNVLHDVDRLLPDIEASAEQTERDRAVPEPLIARLAEAGVCRWERASAGRPVPVEQSARLRLAITNATAMAAAAAPSRVDGQPPACARALKNV
jgi:hypothetical protein